MNNWKGGQTACFLQKSTFALQKSLKHKKTSNFCWPSSWKIYQWGKQNGEVLFSSVEQCCQKNKLSKKNNLCSTQLKSVFEKITERFIFVYQNALDLGKKILRQKNPEESYLSKKHFILWFVFFSLTKLKLLKLLMKIYLRSYGKGIQNKEEKLIHLIVGIGLFWGS